MTTTPEPRQTATWWSREPGAPRIEAVAQRLTELRDAVLAEERRGSIDPEPIWALINAVPSLVAELSAGCLDIEGDYQRLEERAAVEARVLASAPAPAAPSVVVTEAMVDVLYDQLHSIGLAIGDDECSAALTAALAGGRVGALPAKPSGAAGDISLRLEWAGEGRDWQDGAVLHHRVNDQWVPVANLRGAAVAAYVDFAAPLPALPAPEEGRHGH